MAVAAAPDRTLEKQERFRRLAEQRTNQALVYIERLIRCSDTSRYAYTEKQADTIVAALRDATDAVQAAFTQNGDAKLRVKL